MKIIAPRPFDPAKITSSPALTETLWAAGTRAQGDRRYVLPSYDLFEALTTTTDEPVAGAAKDPATWVRVGKVNRFAMFDELVGHPATDTVDIEIDIAPDGTITNAVALFGVEAGSVTIEMSDPTDGTVYSRTLDLVDNSGVGDWWAYFYAPVVRLTDVVVDDLPSYATGTVHIELEGPASVGEIVLGRAEDLGITQYGTGVSILDFSRKDRDTFGNAVLIQRAFAARVQFTGKVFTAQVGSVVSRLAARRALPTVYYASAARRETLAFGFYRDFSITLAAPSVSDFAMEVEGLT
jgi:hypothetical protein